MTPNDTKAQKFMDATRRTVDEVITHRRALTEEKIRGCVAGGLCGSHHIEIVTMDGCGCEGVHVLPFGVAFWTAVRFDNEAQEATVISGWNSRCPHGAPTLGLSAPATHAIIGANDRLH